MSTRLFIGNLNFKLTDRELRDAFAVHAAVVNAEIVKDRFDGRSRGFGFVELDPKVNPEMVIAATDGAELAGRPMRVELATGAGAHRRESGGDYARRE